MRRDAASVSDVVTRLDRVIQYAAALMPKYEGSGILGGRSSRAMTALLDASLLLRASLQLRATLLPRPRGRELAIADAGGEAFRIGRDRVFAVGSDQLSEGGEQACLCQAVAIDAIVARLGPGLVEIAERGLLLFLIGQRIAGGSKRRWMAHETRQAVARSRAERVECAEFTMPCRVG